VGAAARRAGRIPRGREAFLETIQLRHRRGVEREVEQRGVLRDVRSLDRPAQHDVAVLEAPAQQDLGRCAADPARDRGEPRIAEPLALGQRAVRLDHDVVLVAQRAGVAALKVW
jgi:hypothetical protein